MTEEEKENMRITVGSGAQWFDEPDKPNCRVKIGEGVYFQYRAKFPGRFKRFLIKWLFGLEYEEIKSDD